MLDRREFLGAGLAAALASCGPARHFLLSVLVDFVDDAGSGVYTPRRVDAMMRMFREMAIRRVYWIHYGDESVEGFWRPYGSPDCQNRLGTIRALGQPIRVAVDAARRHGLEIYAFFKPYETGISMIFPEGSPEGRQYGEVPHLGSSLPCLMRVVREHPELRIRRRRDDLPPNVDRIPVHEIRLYGRTAAPTRIGKANLQIWTSEHNYRYQRKPVEFSFSSSVEPAPQDFLDLEGKTLAARGDPVRVLKLAGLHLSDRYILLTTDFDQGPGNFELSAVDMLQAFGPDGLRIPISIGAGGACGGDSSIWCQDKLDFRNWGIEFDIGFGRSVVKLDVPNRTGKLGYVAFVRGRNEYLPAALCECYPEVQKLWLEQLRACLDAGVDGIDFRIENHCTHTDDPFSYGFNDIVLEEYQRRYGQGSVDRKLLARIRGERYTAFLREAGRMIRARGKKMQLHLNVEFLRPDPRPSRYLAYPWNIDFDWRGWLREGLADEVTLRTFQYTPEFVLHDGFSQEVIAECQRRSLPLHYNRYTGVPDRPTSAFVADLERIWHDGRFRGFIVYESANFLVPDGGEGLLPKYGVYEGVREKARRLGLS
jgi:hypothetical protein